MSIKIMAAQSHDKPIDYPKLTTGHFIALQREERQYWVKEAFYTSSFPKEEGKKKFNIKNNHLHSPLNKAFGVKV